jgi:hypothetical protein
MPLPEISAKAAQTFFPFPESERQARERVGETPFWRTAERSELGMARGLTIAWKCRWRAVRGVENQLGEPQLVEGSTFISSRSREIVGHED